MCSYSSATSAPGWHGFAPSEETRVCPLDNFLAAFWQSRHRLPNPPHLTVLPKLAREIRHAYMNQGNQP